MKEDRETFLFGTGTLQFLAMPDAPFAWRLDFFKIFWRGDGRFAVAKKCPRMQEQSGAAATPAAAEGLGAWLHIVKDGKVHRFAGERRLQNVRHHCQGKMVSEIADWPRFHND